MNEYFEYFKYFIMGLDGIVLLSLIIAILAGLIRGFPKTMNKLIKSIIICAFVLTFFPLVTKTVVNIEFSGEALDFMINKIDINPEYITNSTYSLREIIGLKVWTNVYGANPAYADPELASLVTNASSVVLNIASYIVTLILSGILAIILSIVFAILRGIFGIKLKKFKKRRLFGALIGVGEFAISFILFVLPVYGILTLSKDISNDLLTYSDTLSLDNETVEMLDALKSSADESLVEEYLITPVSKVFKSKNNLPIDAMAINNILSFEHNGQKVKLYEEYLSVSKSFPTIGKIKRLADNQTISLNELDDEDFDNIRDLIKNSKLLRVAIPSIFEYISYAIQDENKNVANILNDNNINWDKEFTNLSKIIDTLKKHKNINIDLQNPKSIFAYIETVDFLRDILENLFDLEIVTDVALPFAANILIEQFKEEEIATKYNLDFNILKTIDWKNDGKVLALFIVNVYEVTVFDLEVDKGVTIELLKNEKLPDDIVYIFNELDKVDIIKNKVLKIAYKFMIASLIEKPLKELDINYDELASLEIENSLTSLGNFLSNTVKAIQVLNIDFDDNDALLDNILSSKELSKELKKVIDSALEIDIVSNHLLPIAINYGMEKLSENEKFKYFDFDEIKKTNWKEEIQTFADVLYSVIDAYQELEFDKDNWQIILENEKFATYVETISSNIMKSTLTKEQIIPGLSKLLDNLLDEKQDSIQFDINILKELTSSSSLLQILENDPNKLANILTELNKLGIFEKENTIDFKDEVVQDHFVNIIKSIFSLSPVKGNEAKIFDLILTTANINKILEESNITIDLQSVTNWENEINNICEIFKDIMKVSGKLDDFDFSKTFTDNKNEESRLIIARIFDNLGKSEIFKDVLFDFINNIIANVGDYKVAFSEKDKNEIRNVTTWKQEVLTIFEIVDKKDIVESSSSIEGLDGVLVKDIMLTASNSVIASKILGTLLNAVLGDNITFDLSNRYNMKTCANLVYNAISLSQIITNPSSIDLNNPDDVKDLIDNVKALAENEEATALVNQLLNSMTDSEITLTTTDITEAADVINDVISIYQETSNQDEFNLDDLSEEDKEKVEESELAKILLGYFFE